MQAKNEPFPDNPHSKCRENLGDPQPESDGRGAATGTEAAAEGPVFACAGRGKWRRTTRFRAVGNRGTVAQLVEHEPFKLVVAGSSPARLTTFSAGIPLKFSSRCPCICRNRHSGNPIPRRRGKDACRCPGIPCISWAGTSTSARLRWRTRPGRRWHTRTCGGAVRAPDACRSCRRWLLRGDGAG